MPFDERRALLRIERQRACRPPVTERKLAQERQRPRGGLGGIPLYGDDTHMPAADSWREPPNQLLVSQRDVEVRPASRRAHPMTETCQTAVQKRAQVVRTEASKRQVSAEPTREPSDIALEDRQHTIPFDPTRRADALDEPSCQPRVGIGRRQVRHGQKRV